MAYDRQKIEAKALKAIEENELTFFDEICLFVEPSRKTLYEWEMHKSDIIKEAIEKNRVKKKNKMRNKWGESDNATLQIAAYKLIAEPEEIDRITVNKFEHSGKDGGPIQTENKLIVEVHDYTDGPKAE